MALSTLVPLYFLSLPVGHAGLVVCNKFKLAPYLDSGFVPDLFTEGIDYEETRGYVKLVYGYYGAYRRLYK